MKVRRLEGAARLDRQSCGVPHALEVNPPKTRFPHHFRTIPGKDMRIVAIKTLPDLLFDLFRIMGRIRICFIAEMS